MPVIYSFSYYSFASQVDEILSHADLDNTQLLLFSATLPDNVLALAETIMPAATRVAVGK